MHIITEKASGIWRSCKSLIQRTFRIGKGDPFSTHNINLLALLLVLALLQLSNKRNDSGEREESREREGDVGLGGEPDELRGED